MTSEFGRRILAVFMLAALALGASGTAFSQQIETPPAGSETTAPAQPAAQPQQATQPEQATQPQSQPATQPQAGSSDGGQPAEAARVAPATPQAAARQNASQRADGWKIDLDNMLLALQREGITEEQMAGMRADAERIAEEARKLEAQLQPEHAAIQARLNELGPAPGADQPPEAPDIAARRASEQAALAAADSALKKVKLVIVQAEQVTREIASLRRDRFAQGLSQRNRSILNPTLWFDGLNDLPKVTRSLSFLLGDSWAFASSRASTKTAAGLAGAVLLVIAAWVVIWRLASRYTAGDYDDKEVSRLRKLLRAFLVVAMDGFLPVLAVFILYLILETSGLLTARLIELNRSLFTAVAIFSFLFGLSRGICAPLRPTWRLIDMSDTAAAKTVASVTAIAVVLAVSTYLETTNDLLVAPVSVEVIKRAITALLVGIFLASGLWRLGAGGGTAVAGGQAQPGVVWRWLRNFVWVAVFGIFVALATGFIALAYFVAIQLVFAGAVLALAWLLLGLFEELVNQIVTPHSRFGAALSSAFGISESGVTQLALIASGLLRLVVIILGAVLVLLPWGFDTGQWRAWIQKAFFGFRVGEVNISLSLILTALVLFAVGLLATRAIQGWLANRFLPNTRLDLGVRNSIRTIVGYAGVIVAGLFAFSSLGLNLENVAILAGALSVGIGFGLQSIVNNFVSGLILLAERPIKEGDWIVVGAEQGNVRKISIRSTEIETFDRATVIVPNSDLITGTVKNWMHSSMMGRIVIPIGVAYGADPEKVRDILLDIAREHADVLAYPEPRVYFMDFGDSALVFNLYAFVADVNSSLSIRSDFRFEILKRFREAEIEIPFPQRDINFRDIDRLERAISGAPHPDGKTPE